MIKDENFYTVFGWMLNRLHLRGNDLKVYALIYSFSQDGESEYKGNLNFIEEFTGASGATIKRSLARLEAIKYIEKTERNSSTGGTNTYKIVPLDIVFAMLEGVGQNELPPQIKMSYPVAQNELGVGQNELRYINNNNNYKVSKKEDINKDNNNAHARESYQEIIDSPVYGFDERVKVEIWNFIQHCLANKQVLTNERLRGVCLKLIRQFRPIDITGMVDAIRTAISRGYYDIKDREDWTAEAARRTEEDYG